MPVSETAAVCRGVSVDYATEAGVVHALLDVDAAFARGRVNVLAGPSGSGKSSLLRVLAGLQRARSGRVEGADEDLTRLRPGALRRLRRRHIGVVLQDPADNLVAYLSAVEQLRLAARLRGVDPGEAAALLGAAGLTDRAGSRPAELSGGEQQRVAFAAAAIGRPALLLADEPTGELDARTGAEVIALFGRLNRDGTTIVVVTHDEGLARAAGRVVHMRDGMIVSELGTGI